APARVERELPGADLGIVDELVYRDIRAGADAERGFVEEQDLRLPGWPGGETLVEQHLLADHQGARGATRRSAGRLRVDRAVDADPLLGDGWQPVQQTRQQRGDQDISARWPMHAPPAN